MQSKAMQSIAKQSTAKQPSFAKTTRNTFYIALQKTTLTQSELETNMNKNETCAWTPKQSFFSNYCNGIPGLANYEMPSEVC